MRCPPASIPSVAAGWTRDSRAAVSLASAGRGRRRRTCRDSRASTHRDGARSARPRWRSLGRGRGEPHSRRTRPPRRTARCPPPCPAHVEKQQECRPNAALRLSIRDDRSRRRAATAEPRRTPSAVEHDVDPVAVGVGGCRPDGGEQLRVEPGERGGLAVEHRRLLTVGDGPVLWPRLVEGRDGGRAGGDQDRDLPSEGDETARDHQSEDADDGDDSAPSPTPWTAAVMDDHSSSQARSRLPRSIRFLLRGR